MNALTQIEQITCIDLHDVVFNPTDPDSCAMFEGIIYDHLRQAIAMGVCTSEEADTMVAQLHCTLGETVLRAS